MGLDIKILAAVKKIISDAKVNLTESSIISALGYTPINSNKIASIEGIASLDSNGKVPVSQLPPYVNDATLESAISNHNISESSHSEIRDLISELATRLNALADSDDDTLDQLSEIVAYIKSNKSLIDAITTSKVSVSDIIDDLTSNAVDKPLSSKQGKVLNDLITALAADTPSNEYISEHFVPDYVSSKISSVGKQGIGWYRIAQAKYPYYNSCVISMKRGYNSPSPEYQKIQLVNTYTNHKFVSLAAVSDTHIWTKIRETWDGNKAYIEVYLNYVNNNADNAWLITIEDALSGDSIQNNWKSITPVKTEETVSGVTVFASLDLPANFDNTYLLNKNEGGTITGKLIPAGGIEHVGFDGYIAYPSDGVLNDYVDKYTGYLKITLPTSWSNTMIMFTVSIFNYLTGESTDYRISGYPYSPSSSWVNCSAVCIGKAGAAHSNLPVCFGHNGEKCVVVIGGAGTVWNYPKVKVHDIMVGMSNYQYSKWYSGWNIEIDASLPSTVQTPIINTHVAYGCVAGSCTGNSATATKAMQDGDGNVIASTYAKKSELTSASWTDNTMALSSGSSINITDAQNIKTLVVLVRGTPPNADYIYNSFTIPSPRALCESMIGKSLTLYTNSGEKYVDLKLSYQSTGQSTIILTIENYTGNNISVHSEI